MSEQSERLAGQVRHAAGWYDDPDLSVTQIVRGMAETIARLTEEVDALPEVLRERDGGAHDEDCKHHYRPGSCTCGHLRVTEALAQQTATDGGE